jgi:hypothetical protein
VKMARAADSDGMPEPAWFLFTHKRISAGRPVDTSERHLHEEHFASITQRILLSRRQQLVTSVCLHQQHPCRPTPLTWQGVREGALHTCKAFRRDDLRE